MAGEKSKLELEKEFVENLNTLSKSVKSLHDMELIQILKNPWKLMWMALLKGLMVGFGSVLGATVLVALFIYLIAQIQFVPIVGNFVEKIIQEVQTEIESAQPLSNLEPEITETETPIAPVTTDETQQ